MALTMNYSDSSEKRCIKQLFTNDIVCPVPVYSSTQCKHRVPLKEITKNFSSSNLKVPKFIRAGSEDGKTSITTDSGYESPFDYNKKTSRWAKIDEELLHKDFKKFLKLHDVRGKKVIDESDRNNHRSIFKKFLENIDDKPEIDLEMLKKVLAPKSEIVARLVTLRDAISLYMKQRQNTESQIFKLPGSLFGNILDDLKSIRFFDSSSLFNKEIPQIINILFNGLNVSGTEKMIDDMEDSCADREIVVGNAELGVFELKEAIKWMQHVFYECLHRSSAGNIDDLVGAIDVLCFSLEGIAHRLWILSSFVQLC